MAADDETTEAFIDQVGFRYAYDRQSKVGKLDKAWDEAVAKGWTVVDMKRDWGRVFATD